MLFASRWIDPLVLAASLRSDHPEMALLYSGMQTSYSGRYSYLAVDPVDEIISDDLSALDNIVAFLSSSVLPEYFGYLGYELAQSIEKLPPTHASSLSLPSLWFRRYRYVWRFDHQEQITEANSQDALSLIQDTAAINQADMPVAYVQNCTSNMDKATYLDIVERTLEEIRAGSFYQANITRKFYGGLEKRADSFALFSRLSEVSPAPYSAYFFSPEFQIISSSPELFLRIAPDGHMLSRPIKGTARRRNAGNAEEEAEALAASRKDQAENLMIVDLMRNDLARSAVSGSVHVDQLYDIDSFATVHHMSSSVSARLAKKHSVTDAIRGCFPPGSMTGAPKIRAMQWCAEQETLDRGIYSGALGWVGPDACELSVVIRTLLLKDTQYEFQVGGGIVADSIPEQEWQETLDKARGIATALGISEEQLAGL